MRMRLKVIGFCALVGLVAMAGGCHKQKTAAAVPASAPAASPAPAPPGPPTCTVTAMPATVTLGQSVTLSWSTNNATAVQLKPGLGAQQAEGSTSVTPSASTTYSLELTGESGTGECNARVTVTPPSPPSATVAESNLNAVAGAAASASHVMEDAFFDFASANLNSASLKALSHDANYLQAHLSLKVRIGGYCDPRGSEEYNLGLGERRAEAAKTYLVNLGIAANRLSTISYGKDKPFCTEASHACYQRNRRAQVVITSPSQ